jgi:hypothetical protein
MGDHDGLESVITIGWNTQQLLKLIEVARLLWVITTKLKESIIGPLSGA